MLIHDNLLWLISLTLGLLCTNGATGSAIKPDILEALDDIAGFDLNEEEMRRYHIWPQGIISYYIDDFSFDKVLRDRIRVNLDQIGKVTGLHFMEIPQPPKDDENRWVFFLNRKARLDCADVSFSNFTSSGVQRVVLGYDCMKPEDIAEIILSLVGVAPQHNSPDRDQYISVNLENILPDKHYLFKKIRHEDWMFGKFDYDFASAGHYNSHRYTKNGAETITTKNQEIHIERSKGLSAIDIKKIRTTYNYIAYRGKNHITVPECNKLFVTGSNFSNYKSVTKYEKRLKKQLPPTHYDDIITSDNTTNDTSEKVNSNESSKLKHVNDENDVSLKSDEKLKDSKDEIKDKDIDEKDMENKDKDIEDKVNEEDSKDPIINKDTKNLNVETNNDNINESDPNTDNESKQQTNSPDSQKLILEENKSDTIHLLTFIKNNTRSKKRLKNLLFKSDYETGDEGNNNYIHQKVHFQ